MSKFLSLSPLQQERLLAKILTSALKSGNPKELEHYLELQKNRGTPLPDSPSIELLSNELHKHLRKQGKERKESNLVILKGDKSTAAPKLDIDIVLDNLRSSHNVGSIVRTVEAFSLGKLIFRGTTPTLQNPQVQNTSMHAHQWVEGQDWNSIDHLKRPIILLETAEDAVPLHEFTFPNSFTLVLGNEEHGVSEELLDAADHITSIPLFGKKNSLNVANAFGIAAATIRTQLSS